MKQTAQTRESSEVGLELSPAVEEFASLRDYDLAMLHAEVSSDIETPISAFMKLRDSGPCFLLESAESGEMWGRYSFLGFDPMAVLFPGSEGLLVREAEDREYLVPGDPVRALFEKIEGTRALVPGKDMPFTGGAVGYFGYDLLPSLEKVSLANRRPDLPEFMFMVPRKVVMFDHLRSRMRLCVMVPAGCGSRCGPGGGGSASAAERYEEGRLQIERMAETLQGSLPEGSGISHAGTPGTEDDFSGVHSNVSREEFESMVERAREHIFAGDAFQVVVSQRFERESNADPLSIYRHLRADNPSPYMFLLQLPGLSLVGSSPEPMVTCREGRAVIRPIAGTRPRGADPAEDAGLASELASDEKERAEHIMLVDLARNDLGRISEAGTVRVTRLMDVEHYSHVMHMVSEVDGRLKEGCGNYDVLRSSFPAGTVVGAPKVRASEIVDQLENDGRGPYAGAVGYLSYSGDMDTCITIRTVLLEGGTATVQAGAGIVADSVPELEYEETRNKARALLRAVRAAEGGRR